MRKIGFRKYFIFCLFLVLVAPFDVFALASVRFAIRELCLHMEGNLGGLLMIAAGVGGMISAAFGNMKAVYSFIITGIGAFTISSMLSLYFPEAARICSGQAGKSANTRTVEAPANVSKIDEVAVINSFFKNEKSEPVLESPTLGDEEDSDSEIF